MFYRDKIIAEITQLEDYARTCFVQQIGLPNGQGKTVNEFIDSFMGDLTDGELAYANGTEILITDCLYVLLPECRKAEKAKDTYLWVLVSEWIHDNLHQCEKCGEWYNMNKDGYNNGYCPECFAHKTANDPDVIADFMNDLEREQDA